ncbi:hypothetical protein V6N12_034947 [Hibiscus sabdariffa]|uniref:Uncharacterized protein n=1 Tax=Hibiscus sabdariffa TaxID=183260 RepID=A0ABR2BNW0_9ROSI
MSQEEPVIHKSRHLERGVTVKMINNQVDKPRPMTSNVEGSMLTYKRKRKRIIADPPPQVQKWFKLHSYASACKPSQQQSSTEDFVHKGKRTYGKVPIHSCEETNMHACSMLHSLVLVRKNRTWILSQVKKCQNMVEPILLTSKYVDIIVLCNNKRCF